MRSGEGSIGNGVPDSRLDDMKPTVERRWPIAKDVFLGVVWGLLAALFLLHFQLGFIGSSVACAAGVFFLITLYRVYGEASQWGAVVWIVGAGAVGGVAWWLISDRSIQLWEAAAAGACFMAIRWAIDAIAWRAFGNE